MTNLHLPDYLDYIKKYKQPTDKTLQDYRESLAYVSIDDVALDNDKLSETYQTLLKRLPKGAVHIARWLTILSAWAKKNHITPHRDIHYSTLIDEIKRLTGQRRAYTNDELNVILASARATGNNELLNLMLLMTYSGLRIGGCYPLHYDQFEKVEGFDVYSYFVTSKGVRYQAIVAGHVWRDIENRRYGNKRLVVYYDDSFKTPFDKLYRDQLSRLIQRYGLYSIREDTSIFHSFKHSFARHLLTSGVDPKNFYYKALLGHLPRDTTATKFYINSEGEKEPLDITGKIAALYSKSDLMTLNLGVP